MLHVLEAMAIKGVFVLVSRYVVDNNLLRGVRALESVFLTDTAVSTSSPLQLEGDSPNVKRSW